MSAPHPTQQQQPYGYPPPVQQPEVYPPPPLQNYGAAYPPPGETYPVAPPSYENATQPTAPPHASQLLKQPAADVEYGGGSFDTVVFGFDDRTIRRGKTLTLESFT